MPRRLRPSRLFLSIVFGNTLLLMFCASAGGDTGDSDAERGGEGGLSYRVSENYALTTNRDIRESSGVAWGWANGDVLWTHNDSGAAPVVFAIGPKGEDRGMFTLSGAVSVDWEDMASYQHNGRSWLVLADVGDNFLERPYYSLYFAIEPDASQDASSTSDASQRRGTRVARVEKTLRFRYEDAPHNCEAIAVDPGENRVYLATKNTFGQTRIYQLDIPEIPTGQLRAKHIAEVWINSVTAMDISADGRRAVILTYGPAYEFTRAEGQTWADAFAQTPRRLPTPRRKQGESVCYGPDSQTLYFTNESRYSPLWRMTPSQ